jgi:hypothetical protein
MVRTFLRIIAVALAIASIPLAKADTDYTLDLTLKNYLPASGTVTLVETAPSIQIDGLTLSLEDGTTLAEANLLLAGCSTCMWAFDNNVLPGFTTFYVYSGSSFAQFGCFECSTAQPLYELGTIPVQSKSTSVPEGSSLAMMGISGIGLLGALKRKFPTRCPPL